MDRTDGTGTYQYLYGDPGNPLITAVRDLAGLLTTLFYDEAGHLFALERDGARFYVATDQTGSPRVVSDTSGQVVKVVEYDSFGNVTADSNPGFDLVIGYANGLTDKATGLLRFGFRDYDPQTGRWTSRDPILFAGGQGKLYAYVGSDPINRRDPLGLFCISVGPYAGFGGGVETCITSEGASLCAKVGFGAGAEVNPFGDLADAGTELGAELSVQCGPVTLGGALTLDNTGCIQFAPAGQLGPITFDEDLKPGLDVLDPDAETPNLGEFKGKCSAEGKIYGKKCFRGSF